MSKLNREIEREIKIHGGRWDNFHRGYFSNPVISDYLVKEVMYAVKENAPSIVIDLGGGTGFILSELLKKNIAPNIRLIDLDLSLRQLNRIGSGRIQCMNSSLSEFKRGDIARQDDRVLFLMRSVLHYFGRDGLAQELRYLRSQMEVGEYFIHQTACFDSPVAAGCLNTIYAGMKTGKWYPVMEEIVSVLEDNGWEINRLTEVPHLCLDSRELKERYHLTDGTIRLIREEVKRKFGKIGNIYRETPVGFIAYLPYKIFICRAY